MEIELIYQGHPLWEKVAAFARGSSWSAGPYLANMMEKNAFRDWERVAAAVDGDRIAGYCVFAEKDELPEEYGFSPFIGFVFVDEKYRGRRISEQMIREVTRYAGTLGFPKVYLMSGEQGLYEKYGFEKIGDYPTVFGTTDQLFQKNTGEEKA